MDGRTAITLDPDIERDGPTTTTDALPEWRRFAAPVPHPLATAMMLDRVAAIRDGRAAPEAVWLLEHPPTFTAGTSARPEDLSNPLGFPTYATGRGGQWTYHGPGQRVAYVLLDLHRAHGPVPPRDVRAFVAALEQWLIDALDRLGVAGGRRVGRVGVWVTDPATGADNKIAALGVRMTRWVSWHGVSLNVDPALDHFGGIVPCGIREHGMTSLRALGLEASLHEVDAALAACWPACFGGPVPSIREA